LKKDSRKKVLKNKISKKNLKTIFRKKVSKTKLYSKKVQSTFTNLNPLQSISTHLTKTKPTSPYFTHLPPPIYYRNKQALNDSTHNFKLIHSCTYCRSIYCSYTHAKFEGIFPRCCKSILVYAISYVYILNTYNCILLQNCFLILSQHIQI